MILFSTRLNSYKTFIAVVMVSLLLAILPAISMWGFMSITFSEHDTMVETFNGYLNDYDYQSSLPEDYVYQAVNLKMDSTANLYTNRNVFYI